MILGEILGERQLGETIIAKLKSAAPGNVYGQLRLPFELRQKSRLRTQLVSGEEVAVMLPRGEIMRGGDLVATADNRVIEVIAAPENVLHIECASATELTRDVKRGERVCWCKRTRAAVPDSYECLVSHATVKMPFGAAALMQSSGLR